MKKLILLSVLAVSMVAAHAQEQEGYTIRGSKMYGSDGTPIALVLKNGEQMDTLAVSKIINGEFEFHGIIAGKKLAHLHSAGRTVMPLFLENKEYDIVIGNREPIVKGGGHDQQIKSEYDQIYNRQLGTVKELQDWYKEAYEHNDTARVNMLNDVFSAFMKLLEKEQNLFVATHPDELATAYVIQESIGKVSDETVLTRYQLLSEKARNTIYGKAVGEYVQTIVGATVPDFTLETPKGQKLSLYEMKGKVKIIDFWASWCPPCRAESKNLRALYDKYHRSGLDILSITMDKDKKAWKKAMVADGMIWNNGYAEGAFESEAARRFMVSVIPTLVVLDGNNRVVARGLMGESLMKKIEELMSE